MATISSTLPALLGRLQRLPDRQTLAAVRAVRKAAQTEVRREVGGDQRMSNVGRRGVKLGTADNWRAGARAADVWARPAAQWGWLEQGTGAHVIGVGRRSRKSGNYAARRFRQRKVLYIGGRYVTAPVFHPGTRPARTWTRTRRRAVPEIRRAARLELAKAVRGG